MSDLILRAKSFAHYAHDFIDQKRKYSGEPYWTHTDAVAALVERYGGSPEMVAAAHLHDVLEDVNLKIPFCNEELLNALFGRGVCNLVIDLTDHYNPEGFPNWNRAKRKQMEALRLADCSDAVKLIKCADIYHNTKSIVKEDPGFAKIYLKEKEYLLSVMQLDCPLYYSALNNSTNDTV